MYKCPHCGEEPNHFEKVIWGMAHMFIVFNTAGGVTEHIVHDVDEIYEQGKWVCSQCFEELDTWDVRNTWVEDE